MREKLVHTRSIELGHILERHGEIKCVEIRGDHIYINLQLRKTHIGSSHTLAHLPWEMEIKPILLAVDN